MKPSKLSSLSVFFPCFNEAENLPSLIEDAVEYLPTITEQFEIIVVNDGSTDETSQVLQKLTQKYSQVRVVTHESNKGYGASLKTGIRTSKYRWIFWTDADQQFHINTLNIFIPKAQEDRALIGYRKHRADTLIRRLNGELYTILINTLFGLKVKDIDCAFKLIPAKDLHSLSIEATGAFTSAEILIRLHAKGIKFIQIPVPHFQRKFGTPTGGSFKVIFRGLSETILFYLQKSYLQ